MCCADTPAVKTACVRKIGSGVARTGTAQGN